MTFEVMIALPFTDFTSMSSSESINDLCHTESDAISKVQWLNLCCASVIHIDNVSTRSSNTDAQLVQPTVP